MLTYRREKHDGSSFLLATNVHIADPNLLDMIGQKFYI